MAYGAESKAAAIERMRECKHHSGSPNYSLVSRELGITRITLRRWWEAAEADPVTPILEKAKRPEKLTRGGERRRRHQEKLEAQLEERAKQQPEDVEQPEQEAEVVNLKLQPPPPEPVDPTAPSPLPDDLMACRWSSWWAYRLREAHKLYMHCRNRGAWTATTIMFREVDGLYKELRVALENEGGDLTTLEEVIREVSTFASELPDDLLRPLAHEAEKRGLAVG